MGNPMVPGTKVNAIYGFCDIRQFTDTTECLQEDVMVFVNSIGQIVHEAVHRNGGAPNKNIGDAFLVVWKLGKVTKDNGDRRGSQIKGKKTREDFEKEAEMEEKNADGAL